MNELQKLVSSKVNEMIISLMDLIKKAEKEGKYPDLAEFSKIQADTNNSMNLAFIDCKVRNSKKKMW